MQSVIEKVPLAKLVAGRDIRDQYEVSGLMRSMVAVGLLHPLLVRKDGEHYRIWAGHRRFHAAKELGWREIDVRLADGDDLHIELAAIDENLARESLSFKAEAREIARRKELYELLHPATRHGGKRRRKQTDASRRSDDKKKPPRFSKQTAESTGRSERTVQRLAQLGESAIDEVLDAVDRGLITKDQAIAVAKLEPMAQRAELARIVSKTGKATVETRAIQLRKCLRRTAKAADALAAALAAAEAQPPRQKLVTEIIQTAVVERTAVQHCAELLGGGLDAGADLPPSRKEDNAPSMPKGRPVIRTRPTKTDLPEPLRMETRALKLMDLLLTAMSCDKSPILDVQMGLLRDLLQEIPDHRPVIRYQGMPWPPTRFRLPSSTAAGLERQLEELRHRRSWLRESGDDADTDELPAIDAKARVVQCLLGQIPPAQACRFEGSNRYR